jgi:hypothetical protein
MHGISLLPVAQGVVAIVRWPVFSIFELPIETWLIFQQSIDFSQIFAGHVIEVLARFRF